MEQLCKRHFIGRVDCERIHGMRLNILPEQHEQLQRSSLPHIDDEDTKTELASTSSSSFLRHPEALYGRPHLTLMHDFFQY